MPKGGMLRTKSARGRIEVDDFNGPGVLSPPAFLSSEAQPSDDLYTIQNKPTTERKHSSSHLRTSSSPNRHVNKTKQVVPIQKDRHPSHGLALPNLPQPHAIYSTNGQEDAYIGIALGSPSQNPLPQLPLEVEEPPSFVNGLPVFADQSMPETGDLLKQKGRWKMFGGFFGKKSSSTPVSPDSPFYQLQSPGASHQDSKTSRHYNGPYRDTKPYRNTHSPSKLTEKEQKSPKKLQAQRKQHNKPKIKRSHTLPVLYGERRSPTPPPKDVNRSQTDGGPMLLQVEIPNVAMERYSIMFGNVLQPKQPPLLVRRQAQLEKLKTKIGDEGALEIPKYDDGLLKPVRRATSPSSLSKSPSFSLFPSTPSVSNRSPSPSASYKPSPLQRSATVPNASSPMRQTFEHSRSSTKEQNPLILMVHSPAQSSDTLASSYRPKWSSDLSPTSTEASLTEDADLNQTHRDAVFTDLKLSSPPESRSHVAPGELRLATQPLKQHQFSRRIRLADDSNQREPYPEKALPKSNIQVPISSFSTRKTKPMTTQKFSSIVTTNPLTSSPPSATEISIARKISLSRRQRHLLVPIVSKTATQPMQATLVSVEKQEGEGKGEGVEWRGHISRKSSHVLIEDA